MAASLPRPQYVNARVVILYHIYPFLSSVNDDTRHPNILPSMHHDDVIKWKHFPRYWPFVRSPVNSPHKGQWCRALMFSLICAWMNAWLNNRDVGDLRRHRAHYDVIVMYETIFRYPCDDFFATPDNPILKLKCNVCPNKISVSLRFEVSTLLSQILETILKQLAKLLLKLWHE